jgi:hypothetical protein
MNGNDTATTGSSPEDRSRAREHLARQIGRLLAREWLRKKHDGDGQKPRETNEIDVVA